MRADTHNHTCHFSPDAHMTIDELIETATERHLDIVGITEHYEYDNPDPDDNIQTFDLDEYTSTFPQWQAKCPSGLTLLKGIEFGYQRHTAGKIDEIASSNGFDIVILSRHLFRGIDVAFSKEVYKLDRITRNSEYIGKLAEMAETVNEYSVIAHYDYIDKYNPERGSRISYEDCPAEFDRLFEAIISKDKALEINKATSMKRSTRPDPEVIKRYLTMGGRLITLGSDAHVKENLGVSISDFEEYLKSLGVRELCYFRSRQPFTYGI